MMQYHYILTTCIIYINQTQKQHQTSFVVELQKTFKQF